MNSGPDNPVPSFDGDTVFRELFSAYPDGLLVVDAQGRIVLANPSVERLLGYTMSELRGMNVDALVPDAVRPDHARFRAGYAQTPRARPMGTQMDLVARRRDGSEVPVEIALSPLHDKGLPYVVAAVRGLEAYPRVKRALRRAHYADYLARFGLAAVDADDAQTLLQLLPELAADALQVDSALVLMIEPDERQFRIVAGVGLYGDEAVGGLLPNEAGSPLNHVFSQGHPTNVDDYAHETRFKTSAQLLHGGLCSKVAVPLSDRRRTIGVLDVRSREPRFFGDDETRFLVSLASLMGTVLQREKMEQALNHSQRLESVGQLTGGIAHDFNNLLTVISGNLQVIEDTDAFAQDPALRQFVAAAARATKRGAELTGKLLAFSRRQVLQPAVIDIQALLRSLTDMLRRTLDQRISIEVDTGELLCLVDPVQLESALLNVAINARDAMPEGGRLTFTGRAVEGLPAELAEQTGEPAHCDGYVSIAVSDTGIGMPESVQARAFEPFFTTKETGRGTGLGLATVYGFVRQSQGALSLRSAPGAGTTITLYLPRVRKEADASGPSNERFDRIPTGLKVLLVEDDPEVSGIVQRFLGALSCEVVCCSNAEQALDRLAGDAGFELMLTDISLGAGMRGTELADHAQAARPDLPVLLMSGFSSQMFDTPSGRELLRKPYTRSQLEQAIVKVLRRR